MVLASRSKGIKVFECFCFAFIITAVGLIVILQQSPLDAECSLETLSLCDSKYPGFGMSFGNTVKDWCLGALV